MNETTSCTRGGYVKEKRGEFDDDWGRMEPAAFYKGETANELELLSSREQEPDGTYTVENEEGAPSM